MREQLPSAQAEETLAKEIAKLQENFPSVFVSSVRQITSRIEELKDYSSYFQVASSDPLTDAMMNANIPFSNPLSEFCELGLSLRPKKAIVRSASARFRISMRRFRIWSAAARKS
jgi:hypothetical protein